MVVELRNLARHGSVVCRWKTPNNSTIYSSVGIAIDETEFKLINDNWFQREGMDTNSIQQVAVDRSIFFGATIKDGRFFSETD